MAGRPPGAGGAAVSGPGSPFGPEGPPGPASPFGQGGPPKPGGGVPGGPAGMGQTVQKFGHAVRHYPLAISATALALAWARQEEGPHGATIVADREVSPLGRHGKLWTVAPDSTLTCAVVIRPQLAAEEGDLAWLIAALGAAEGAEAVSGHQLGTWWPDGVVDAGTRQPVAQTKAEVQLGPGQVRSAVITIRIDLASIGLDSSRRDDVLEAVLKSVDEACAGLADGTEGLAAAFDQRCRLLGERVKIKLMPKGETRGVVRRVDRMARLELESSTGMTDRVTIDALRELEVV